MWRMFFLSCGCACRWRADVISRRAATAAASALPACVCAGGAISHVSCLHVSCEFIRNITYDLGEWASGRRDMINNPKGTCGESRTHDDPHRRGRAHQLPEQKICVRVSRAIICLLALFAHPCTWCVHFFSQCAHLHSWRPDTLEKIKKTSIKWALSG